MIHKIPAGNWTQALVDKIELAKKGDVIEVHSHAMKELAEKARLRMCPQKNITFKVQPCQTPPLGVNKE